MIPFFVMGEDVGVYGGAFKVTKGFIEEFGERRVIDTPLSESAIVGAGTGAALNGLRPVLEMQFADFMACGFDQITNFAAKCRYRWGAAVPMVIRAPSGGAYTRRGSGPRPAHPGRRPVSIRHARRALRRPSPSGGSSGAAGSRRRR
jgi:pyruvate/2-oxoglutarate/acetoin dehydrogenase E1 component